MIFIGLDLSTSCTGGAVCIESVGKKKIYAFSIFTPKKLGLDERIEFVRRELAIKVDHIEKEHGKITLVCIEAVPFMNRPGSSQLNDLNGVVRNMLFRRGIAYRLVNVSTWKKYILGTGRPVDKKESLNYCNKNGYPVINDNESDAVCIMLWGKDGGLQEFTERKAK